MRRAVATTLVASLAACSTPGWPSAWRHYLDGIDARRNRPREAERHFADARASAQAALEGGIDGAERIASASVLVRSCIELGDFAGAEDAIEAHAGVFDGVDPDERTPGDVAGLALLRGAWHRRRPDGDYGLQLDRALAAYVAADARVLGLAAKSVLDRHKVDVLSAKSALHLKVEGEGRAAARESARRAIDAAIELCRGHLGKAEPLEAGFDARLKELERMKIELGP